jgi:hypothetical protein
MPIDTQIKRDAMAALGGMSIIVNNEMLKRRQYVSERVIDHALADTGALCGGHGACAVGSLLIGGGVSPVCTDDYGNQYYDLPMAFVDRGKREEFLAEKENAGLKLAYDALNEAAQRFADERGIDLEESTLFEFRDVSAARALELHGAMEALFEFERPDSDKGDEDYTLTRLGMLKLIADAADIIGAA